MIGMKLYKLAFCNYIDYILSKGSRSTGIFHKIRNNFILSARLIFYYGFFLFFLPWGGTCPTH